MNSEHEIPESLPGAHIWPDCDHSLQVGIATVVPWAGITENALSVEVPGSAVGQLLLAGSGQIRANREVLIQVSKSWLPTCPGRGNQHGALPRLPMSEWH